MGVNVLNFFRIQARVPKRALDRPLRPLDRWGDQIAGIRAHAEARDLPIDPRAARLGALERLEHDVAGLAASPPRPLHRHRRVVEDAVRLEVRARGVKESPELRAELEAECARDPADRTALKQALRVAGELHDDAAVLAGLERLSERSEEAPWVFATIAEIQGAAHVSPLVGRSVTDVEGVVTARRTAGGRGFWIEDPSPDADPATSDGVFVFLNAAPAVAVGTLVQLAGTVTEFRPGNDPDNLTITQISTSNANVTTVSTGNPLPGPTVLGTGGVMPPTETIDDDGAGNVETGRTFEPDDDAIDFYESLEGMRVQVNDAQAVGPRNAFGEIAVVVGSAGLRTPRGGIVIRPGDFNPERLHLSDWLPGVTVPDVHVGDHVDGSVVGVLDYAGSNYKVRLTESPVFEDGGLERGVGTAVASETTPWRSSSGAT